jgi:hypothetical protein
LFALVRLFLQEGQTQRLASVSESTSEVNFRVYRLCKEKPCGRSVDAGQCGVALDFFFVTGAADAVGVNDGDQKDVRADLEAEA